MKILAILVGIICLVTVQAAEETKDASSAPRIYEDTGPEEGEDSEHEESPLDDLENEDVAERYGAPAPPAQSDLSDGVQLTISSTDLRQYWNINKHYYYKPTSPTCLRCCPKWWNYGCRSSSYPLPCFYDRYTGKGEWCCPLFPQVYARRCLCRDCAILGSTCFEKGHCARRYTRRWFVAICHRNGFWAYLRTFYKWVPSSCYCRPKYGIYYANQQHTLAAAEQTQAKV